MSAIRQSRSSDLDVHIEAQPRTFPIRRYQAGPSVPKCPDADKIKIPPLARLALNAIGIRLPVHPNANCDDKCVASE